MEVFLTVNGILALVTLSAMEIVLGIDNIIFISILVGRIPDPERSRVRSLGISLALLTRILLLFSITWLMQLNEPFIHLGQYQWSGRDLILLAGGLFLIAKATHEIHVKIENGDEVHELDSQNGGLSKNKKRKTFGFLIFQILILDIVFSLDSVITAVGMVNSVAIMIVAMTIAMVVMLVSSGFITNFVSRHPTIKILALAFLILIGVMLTMEGMGQHVEKGYIYFAMFFSLGVELLNMRYRIKSDRIKT